MDLGPIIRVIENVPVRLPSSARPHPRACPPSPRRGRRPLPWAIITPPPKPAASRTTDGFFVKLSYLFRAW